MAAKLELCGDRYGRLQVLRAVPHHSGRTAWECLCDCGSITTSTTTGLRSGDTQSCGCLHLQRATEANTIHGKRFTREHSIWTNMNARCRNPKNDDFASYGGRGISVCTSWLDFATFYADMGECPVGMTLDRKDVNKGYSPENCRWATATEQANNKRNSIRLSFGGVTLPLKSWATSLGISYDTLRHRVNQGWSVKKTLTRPIGRWV